MILDCPFSHLYQIVSKVRKDLRLDALKLIDLLQHSEVLNIVAGSRETSFQVRLVRDREDNTPDAVGNQKHLMRIFVGDDGGVTVAPYWGSYQSVKKSFSKYLAETDNRDLKQLQLEEIEPADVVDLLEAAANDVL